MRRDLFKLGDVTDLKPLEWTVDDKVGVVACCGGCSKKTELADRSIDQDGTVNGPFPCDCGWEGNARLQGWPDVFKPRGEAFPAAA